jgi:bacterial leucyl aminopeptidase
MKISRISALAVLIQAISARFVEENEVNNVRHDDLETYLIELAPGETRWVTEDEKWELRRVCNQSPRRLL